MIIIKKKGINFLLKMCYIISIKSYIIHIFEFEGLEQLHGSILFVTAFNNGRDHLETFICPNNV
jgi:hypothetical protein